jgi:RNA polymerase nonessential primary-like sigma factor
VTKVKHSDDDAALYRRIADGDIGLRNEMAERHFGLVQKLATYYAKRNPHLEMDDLIQEGRIGVLVALEKFNVDKGFRFSTYATYWIKHYIQRYMVGNHSGGATASKKDTEAYLARKMSDEDIRIYEARCIRHQSMSGETPNGTNYEETVPDLDSAPVEELPDARMEWHGVERVLFDETISERQRTVVCMRFGVLGYRPHTVPEVARELGVPPIRVTAIEQTTVMHISTLMEDTDGDD